ncbi:MAG TPA: penicillin-binding protein activator [Xanthobacteraceae bacterium]|nr:penicillin-binding protein activator [Xanthobacteraceae bacterium]
MIFDANGSRPARVLRGLAVLAGLALAGCAGSGLDLDIFSSKPPLGQPLAPPPAVDEAPPPAPGGPVVRVGLVLPLSAKGNAGTVALSMRNAAELALAEFGNVGIQLIVKDDAGTAPGAQAAVQAAIGEGAVIVLGPLFSHTVAAAGQMARSRGVPLIAFSTDANVAARGVYLLSFLPESDVDRMVSFAISRGKRSFVAVLPDSAYGSVVEAQFQQVVSARGGRVIAIEKYSAEKAKLAEPARRAAAASRQADSLFFADAGDTTPGLVQALAANGVKNPQPQFMGTGLWDDAALFANPALAGAWFAAPDAAGYRAFAQRYRARYGRDPVRTASLAYDAVSLVASLVRAGGGRISDDMLTNPSGFSGIDGVFRFRPDGTCERGLAVMEIGRGSARIISPAPRAFSAANL